MSTNKKSVPVNLDTTILWKDSTPDETDSRCYTRALLNPGVQAGCTIQAIGKFKSNEFDFIAELHEQVEAVNRGDMKRPEAMLLTQAHTLNEAFNGFTKKAFGQQDIKRLEIFMRLALKSQTQSRATLETLSNIKNPPVVYTKQANITSGPQQVNNNAAPSRTRKINKNKQNKLSGGNHELLPDTGTSKPASKADPEMEAVGKINRTNITGRQS